jgi:hypothetical protein
LLREESSKGAGNRDPGASEHEVQPWAKTFAPRAILENKLDVRKTSLEANIANPKSKHATLLTNPAGAFGAKPPEKASTTAAARHPQTKSTLFV